MREKILVSYMDKTSKKMINNFWRNTKSWVNCFWKHIKSWIVHTRWIPSVLYPVIVAGVSIYFVRYYIALHNKETIESPLSLASVAAALGGFILLGAFYKEKYEGQGQSCRSNVNNNKHVSEKELKNIAKLFLGASISFVVTYLLLPMLTYSNYISSSPTEQTLTAFGFWLVAIISGIAILAALYTFSVAIVALVEIVRKM